MISIPEPEFKLYEDGFEGRCQLGRKADGERLSELVERVSHPLVIALDAPWGAGKSFFLKCWVGAHGTEIPGDALTVYFDAFKNDFLDEPLIGLTAALSARIDVAEDDSGVLAKGIDRLKRGVVKIWRPALRVGAAAATAGLSEGAAPAVDEAVKAASDELGKATEAFWTREDGRRAAMDAFRETLKDMAAERKLVIVVDELDRCRPDYALQVLEVIKHFFDVPNVHFILGVNLEALANSVRARYGAGIDAERYLQKFVTVRIGVLDDEIDYREQSGASKHFFSVAERLGLVAWVVEFLDEYFAVLTPSTRLVLRDVERIATLAMVAPVPAKFGRVPLETIKHLYIGVIILQVLRPDLLAKAKVGRLEYAELGQVFSTATVGPDRERHVVRNKIWQQAVGAEVVDKTRIKNGGAFAGYGPKGILRDVITSCIDGFQLPKKLNPA